MQIQSIKFYLGKCKSSLCIKMVDKVAAKAALMPVECREQINMEDDNSAKTEKVIVKI